MSRGARSRPSATTSVTARRIGIGSACGPREESESSRGAARASGGGAPRAVREGASGADESRAQAERARYEQAGHHVQEAHRVRRANDEVAARSSWFAKCLSTSRMTFVYRWAEYLALTAAREKYFRQSRDFTATFS